MISYDFLCFGGTRGPISSALAMPGIERPTRTPQRGRAGSNWKHRQQPIRSLQQGGAGSKSAGVVFSSDHAASKRARAAMSSAQAKRSGARGSNFERERGWAGLGGRPSDAWGSSGHLAGSKSQMLAGALFPGNGVCKAPTLLAHWIFLVPNYVFLNGLLTHL